MLDFHTLPLATIVDAVMALTLAETVALWLWRRFTRSGLKPGDWEPCIVEGEASQRIVEHEQGKDCDLVVLGKHGQSATEDLLLGSVSKHVLAEGSTDVLVSTAREA